MHNYQTVQQRLGFIYCPKCSSGNLVNRDNKSISCKDCDYIFYQNNASAVAVVIRHENKIVLVKRARNPKKGMLDFPGGFVDPLESLEDAVHREIFEELGIELENVEYLDSAPNVYEYRGVTYLTTDCFFTCRAKDISKMKPADDVSDYILIDPKDIAIDQLAFESAIKIVTKHRSTLA